MRNYYRTLLRSRLTRPRGHVADVPFARAIELALLGLRGYGAAFPEARAYTMLEFGVAGGTTLEKMLRYRDIFTRSLKLTVPVTCIGFDTFSGLPEATDKDEANVWAAGDFAATRTQVQRRLRNHRDYLLVEGLFSETLPPHGERLESEPPIFVSVDCDYYSSTIDVFDTVIPHAPSGCFFYFDDAQAHYWSERAGEMRAVRELNEGRWGDHLELCEFPLWIETREIRHYKRLYRLLNLETHGAGLHDISATV